MSAINRISGPPLRREMPPTLEERLQVLSPEESEEIQALSDRLTQIDRQDEERIRREYQEKLLFIPQHLRAEIVEALAQAPLNRLSEIHPDVFFRREARKILMIFLSEFLQEQRPSEEEKVEFYALIIPCLKYAPQIFDSHYRIGLDNLRSFPREERAYRLFRAADAMQLQRSHEGDLFIEYLNAPLQARVFEREICDLAPHRRIHHNRRNDI